MTETELARVPDAEQIVWPERPIKTKRIGIVASGNGSTFEAIAEAWRGGEISAGALTLIVTNRSAFAVRRAYDLDIPCGVADLQGVDDFSERSTILNGAFDSYGIQFAHAAGMTQVVEASSLRIPMTNTHPAPLPDDPGERRYGGAGMIGMKVHRKIARDFQRGRIARAGSTVHLIDDEPDHGPIVRASTYDIAERAAVEGIDRADVTAEHIAAWTRADEKQNNIEALAMICNEQYLRRLPDVSTSWVR